MTTWPKDGSPLDFEDLSAPVVKAIRFAYELIRRNRGNTIPWSGPPIGQREAACSLGAKERLNRVMLMESERDQGRDALTEIVGLAIQIGMEQGRRDFLIGDVFKTLTIRLNNYRMGMERLASMEAFAGARTPDPDSPADKELIARIDYARKFVK